MDIAALAKSVLSVAKQFAPLIPGGTAGVAAVEALTELIDGVSGRADPVTNAELAQLRADVNGRLDRTIDSLGDRPN